MLAGILIVALSLILLLYWFRYACILALNREANCANRVASANGLSFLEVREKLKTGETRLDAAHESLNRDYRILRYLLVHAAGLGHRSTEQRILLIDYEVMQTWYRFIRRFSPAQARKSLEERSRILTYLAHQMGRRATSQAAA